MGIAAKPPETTLNTRRYGGIIVHGAAFLVPILGLAAVWAVVGIHPFGEWSVLSVDMRNQYVSFFANMKDQLLLGGQSWLYTFSKALGGDLAGFSAYYLLSPFNLVLLLFPTSALPSGIALVTLLKVGSCGLSMSLLLNRRQLKLTSLLFSIPYALMDYNNAFQQNIMWLDGVILLPLVVLGIEHILEGRRPWLYIISLALAIITCYYIGYIICLFSVLYFLVSYFCFHDIVDGKNSLKNKKMWKPIAHYAASSALAGGLSAVVLVPALISLQGGKAAFSLETLLDPSYATLPDVVSRYLPGTVNMQMLFFGFPQIYCGMLALVCTLLYLINKNVARRAKIGTGILLGVLLLSFIVGPMDRIWHGFNKPVGFLFRYSFLFSFVLLATGWKGFGRLRRSGLQRYLPYVVAGFAAAVLLVWRVEYQHLTTGKVLLGLGLMAAMCVLLWAENKYRKPIIVFGLLGLMLCDLGASTFMAIRRVEYFPYAYYESFVKRNQPVVQAVKNRDQSFYRMEITDTFSDNDPMLLGYNGLSHYSSADKVYVREFLEGLGFSMSEVSVKYAGGSTVAADNLLGVKYLLTRSPPAKPYQLLAEESGIQTWMNQDALPLGIMAGEGVNGLMPAEENLFNVQNDLWQTIVPDLEEPLYRPMEAEPKVECFNLGQRDFYGEALYERQNPEEGAWVEFHLVSESEDTLYLLLTTDNYRGCDIYVNGEQKEDGYLTSNKHGIFALGSWPVGSRVTLRFVPKGNELLIKNAWFAYEDQALLKEMTGRLKQAAFAPQPGSTSARLAGQVNSPGGQSTQLLLTIPYDAGWTATLNGAQVPIEKAFGALMSIQVPQGSHSLVLTYLPRGLVAGGVVTCLSAAIVFIWWLGRRREAKKTKPIKT